MTPTTPSPISDQAAGELLPCPFCGSESKSDNGFSPCESIEYAWCSNQNCSLSTIEFGFTVEEWNRRAAPSPMQKAGLCERCNGSGIDGGRMHTDELGASEYEPYRCELCDGFGHSCSTAPTTGSAPTEINAVRYLKLRERMVMTVPPLAQGHLSLTALDDVLDAAPASPAASVLTDEQISAIVDEFDACHWVDGECRIEGRDMMKLCRALLAASMGGDKS